MFGSTEIPDLIDDNNFTYKKRNYLISDITALDFTRQSSTSSFVFIPVHTSDYLDFTIYFINNEELRINQSIKGKNKVFLEFFKYIQEHSYKNRILKYITMLENDKYFVYNNVKFYKPKDIYLDQLNMFDHRKIYSNVTLASYTKNDTLEIKTKKLNEIHYKKQKLLMELKELKNG